MWLLSGIYQSPPSIWITGMSVVTLISMANLCYGEITGKHLKYSKFWNQSTTNSNLTNNKFSSRSGMLFIYTPSFLAGLASFWLFPHQNLRFLLLVSALTIHYFKRILEVIFIHKYSGSVMVDSGIVISLSYLISTSIMIYSQYLSQGLGEPSIDLKYLGIFLFLLGISGNFYHHYLLSKMRKDGEREYKIPKGGLFDFVVCPHYLFEILGFVGISFISQNLYALSCAIGVVLYLTGRSYVTRKWYLSKFEDFPKHVKAIYPYLF
ncbi:hypothetical protein Dsin_000475 [Dipteronia sinensis]|uniref:3-oxo-5-alpha-steroid 4-dehydrogenase C-terminal domain-containing protein n=1 Tax=Dipteronia sinensis TaxID=43782 RepID=A0AAE0EHT7_9ROSI|nr:hypothetical protein Dsin_000475 [Dipteronia sinensis]